MSNESLYEQVAHELEQGMEVSALWTKAMTKAMGDAEKAKYIYIEMRVAQLTEDAEEEQAATAPSAAPAGSQAAPAAQQNRIPGAVLERGRDPNYLRGASARAKFFCWVGIIIGAVGAVVSFTAAGELSMLGRGEYTEDSKMLFEASLGVGLFFYLSVLIGGIFILNWVYRSNVATRAITGVDLRQKPGFAVFWYFVPIVSLWFPYQNIRDTVSASANHAEPGSVGGTGRVLGWWLLWLGALVLTQLFAAEGDYLLNTNSELASSTTGAGFGYGLWAIASFALLGIVKEIEQNLLPQ